MQLIAGETYSFKVTARNSVGSSVESDVISILAAKPPDAPIGFVQVGAQTTATQIGLQWGDGAYDGASPVLDYQVSYAEASGDNWVVWPSPILSKSLVLTGLNSGVNYKLRVQARNIVNFS